MNLASKVAVCSRSFSRNPVLRAELLSRFGDVTFNDAGLELSGDSLVEFLRGHERAITALEIVDATVLQRLPELHVISKFGVGLDTIDLAAMHAHGKRLGWTGGVNRRSVSELETGGVNRRSVSELVISLAIAMLRDVPAASREVLA